MTLALRQLNCKCFTLTFGHALAVTKSYKAIVNISTTQASNIFQKLSFSNCLQSYLFYFYYLLSTEA